MLGSARLGIAAAALAAPLAGFIALMAAPEADVRWEHHPSHFWLVLAAAATSAVLAWTTADAAQRRGDARLFLVSLAFLASAGFLGLHALATPGVLLDQRNQGFVVATPVGLVLAGALAAASTFALDFARAREIMARARVLRLAVVAVLVAWGAWSLASLPPLDDPTPVESGSALLVAMAVVACLLLLAAVARYVTLARVRGSALGLAIAGAFLLLGEAAAAIAFSRNWRASWWEWHVLLLAAFGLVAVVAQREWHEERFADLYTDETAAGRRELSVVFADLAGFTAFSTGRDPREVSAMLNAYFSVAVPSVVREHGGRVDNLIGDAILAVFENGDHAARAARAALALQSDTAAVAARHPDWPRFRVGVSTGEAMVGVVGAAGGRSYTVIGDTVNVAQRLQAAAEPGSVVVAEATRAALDSATTRSLGALDVKGRPEPVEAHVLERAG